MTNKYMDHALIIESLSYAGYRIMVADDNIINCQLAKRLLEKFGCRVETALNGHEVITQHALQPYDLILMDCQMPDLDGYLTCACLRVREQSMRHTVIIGWTANIDQATIERCRSAGMDDCLSKPVHVENMAQMLSNWLSPQALPSASADPTDLYRLDLMSENCHHDFTELTALFEEYMPQRIADLKSMMRSGDRLEVARIAHLMSGCCASIGAMRLSELCLSVERSAKNTPQEEWHEQLASIEKAYEQVCRSLRISRPSPASAAEGAAIPVKQRG